MSLPFRYKYLSGPDVQVLEVTEENYLDMLHAICSCRPKVAYFTLIIFAWQCTDFYDDATMFNKPNAGIGEPIAQIMRSFIHINYPGSHWATDKEFLYSLLTFLVDKMENIEYNVQSNLGLTFSNHLGKVYERVAQSNRGCLSK